MELPISDDVPSLLESNCDGLGIAGFRYPTAFFSSKFMI